MANPNIVAVTTILGNTSTNLISSTADPFATALVNNAASSGKVYKINSIVVANVDGTAAADTTCASATGARRAQHQQPAARIGTGCRTGSWGGSDQALVAACTSTPGRRGAICHRPPAPLDSAGHRRRRRHAPAVSTYAALIAPR